MSPDDRPSETREPAVEADPSRPEPAANRPPASVAAREIIETLLLTFFIFWIVNALIGRYRIDGNSMNPTLHNEDFLLISNFAYDLGEPERGDIVVFRHPLTDENLVKRVIGLPGDALTIMDGAVQVNGVALDEPYIAAAPEYEGEWLVPEDAYFVLGDNRNQSSDSAAWGYLPEERILGKALLVYWPPREWALIPHHAFPSG